MKLKYLFLTLTAVLLAGCSDELDRGESYNLGKDITATIPTYPFDGGTRVNISDDLQTFNWSDGDELGIYTRDTGLTADARFKILQGGSSTGSFSNDLFYLNSSKTYYSFFPYQPYGEIDAVPVDYTSQAQNGNGSAAHLGAYNYMYGTVNINSNGGASIAYKNLGSVMQLLLTVSNAANYSGMDITSDGAPFITKGKASMVDGSITATKTSSTIHLDFEYGITLNAGDVLTANILVAPVDMSGSTLEITLTDIDGKNYEVTTAGKNMLQGRAYLYEETLPYVDDIPYLTFTADAEQTFQMSKAVSTLEYSVNGGAWTELGTTQVTFGGSNGDLRLRGNSSTGTGYSSNASTISFGNSTKVSCSGDIRTLVDYENYTTTDTSEAQFYQLFKNCSSLISAPELPATELAIWCYYGMFENCTSLVQSPELPATTLANYCYREMFSGCTSLTKTTYLPATILAKECYSHMFGGCTSLRMAPIIRATKLSPLCYLHMFVGCTSLTSPPSLPATTLEPYCYSGMFLGCEALKYTPELPATVLAEHCYDSMFQYCTSLIGVDGLPATTLAEGCYESMFSGCTSLELAPDLPATRLENYCYDYMFENCSNLNYIRMMATDLGEFEIIANWVDGVSSTGTFIKNIDATWDEQYIIPEGWTVETE